MTPVPRTTIDITYENINILRLMPECSELQFGWNLNINNKSYLVTSTPEGKCRCQMWTMPNVRQVLIDAVQLTAEDM